MVALKRSACTASRLSQVVLFKAVIAILCVWCTFFVYQQAKDVSYSYAYRAHYGKRENQTGSTYPNNTNFYAYTVFPKILENRRNQTGPTHSNSTKLYADTILPKTHENVQNQTKPTGFNNTNFIVYTIKTSKNYHASRLPVLLKTWIRKISAKV